MRVETVNGRHLLCGGIIPRDAVKVGQRWAPASGGNYEVEVVSAGEWVRYTWTEAGGSKSHEKDNFSFQCRYCLVLDTPEVPAEFQPR
jgi:hypothetical protein